MIEKKVRKQNPPATTPQQRESQLVALAMDLAEKQLRDGTASSQVIAHYLKLGSETTNYERELLKANVKLATAKTESLHNQQVSEALFGEALKAMKTYSGETNENV